MLGTLVVRLQILESQSELMTHLTSRKEWRMTLKLRQHHNAGDPEKTISECFNDWGGRGYDDSVPGEVTKTTPSGDSTTRSPTWSVSLSRVQLMLPGGW